MRDGEGARRARRSEKAASVASLVRRVRLLEGYAQTQALLDAADFDLEPFMQIAVDRLAELTGAMGVVVELLDGDEMVYSAANTLLASHVGLRLQRRGSLSGLCVEQAKLLVCADTETDPRVDREACRRIGARSMVCAPLFRATEAVGVIKLMASKLDAFDADHIEALEFAARAVGAALGKQLSFRQADQLLARQAETLRALEAEIEQRERLERSLTANEARLRSIIDHAAEAILTLDAEGRITAWNGHAQALFGWSAAEAIGHQIHQLIMPADLASSYQARLATFMATGRLDEPSRRIELMAKRRSGEVFPIEFAITASEGPDGLEATVLMHDISERRAQTQQFENAFHHAAIGMALVGPTGRFMKLNDAFCGIVGYSLEEMLELDFQTITHPDDLNEDEALLAQLVTGEIPSYRMEKRYIRKDGRIVWIHLTVSMVVDYAGEPLHFVAQVEDLTARREAEARFRLMAENATDMICTTGFDGRITFASSASRAMTGFTPEELIGRMAMERTHPDDVAEAQAVFRGLLAGKPPRRVRWRTLHRDEDRWVWLESHPTLLANPAGGPPIGYLDVVRDMTAQIAQEEALAQARAEAEAATKVKSEFLANMSHEIRTPLTAMLGYSGLLAERVDLDAPTRGQVARIQNASEALLAIVNDILDFSKLEAGQVEIARRPAAPADLARAALELFELQARAKGLELSIELDAALPGLVSIDPDRLRQVLLNLLGNAVKFTERGSVRLSANYDRQAKKLRLTVQDTGPGLSAEACQRLFQRFSQIDASTTRRHGGTGLGLAICRGLAEAMGGGVSVASQPGEGAAFAVWVNAPEIEAAEEAERAVATGGRLDGLRVLVVDDNAANRDLARAALESLGAEASEAVDGIDAVLAAQSLPVDAILMDLNMPGLSGVEAAARIRAEDGPNQHIPILAFSAQATAAPSGFAFDGFVGKPLARANLAAELARVTAYEEEALHGAQAH